MTRKSLKEYLIESQRVDEVLMTMIAIGLISLAAKPMLTSFADKAGQGVGSFFGGLANLFGFGSNKDKDDSKDYKKSKSKDNNKSKRDSDSNDDKNKDYNAKEHSLFSNLLQLAKKHTTDAANNKVIELLEGSSVDKDGNPLPLNKMGERMQELTGSSAQDTLSGMGVKPLEGDELKKVQEDAEKELKKLTPEQRDELAKKQLMQAQQTSKAMQEYKDKTEKLEKELEDAKKSGDKDKIKAAQKALDAHKKNAKGPAAALQTATDQTHKAKEHKKKQEQLEKELEKAKKSGDKDKIKAAQKALDDHKKNVPFKGGNGKSNKGNKDGRGEPKPKEETFQVTHDGKPDKIIKRKAKPPHDGYVYCYASDKETTLDPKTAEDLIKKSKPKKESLGDYLANIFS